MLCRVHASGSRVKRSGAAAVELAVLAPILAFLFIIAIDWARVFYFTVTINDCARNGAMFLSDEMMTTQSQYKTVTEAALAGTNLSPTPTVTTANGSDSSNRPWVECTVTYPFKTITNFPGVPASTTLTKTVRMYKVSRLPNG